MKTPNALLLRQTLAHIEANRELWDNNSWRNRKAPGGTTYSFPGWVVTLNGDKWSENGSFLVLPDGREKFVTDRAQELLGLTRPQIFELSMPTHLSDLRRVVNELCAVAS